MNVGGLRPGPGILTVLWIVGTYAIASGVLLVALGWRLHGWRRDSSSSSSVQPGAPSGLPTSA